jgi:hypothetical protein
MPIEKLEQVDGVEQYKITPKTKIAKSFIASFVG